MLSRKTLRLTGWAALLFCIVGVACGSREADPSSDPAPTAGGKASNAHAGSKAESGEGGGAWSHGGVPSAGGVAGEAGTGAGAGEGAGGIAGGSPECELPCINGGICRTTSVDDVCVCPTHFAGSRCELLAQMPADEPRVLPEPPANPEPVCTPLAVYEGDVVAADTAALEVLRGVSTLDGNLWIKGSVDDLSALECLTLIRGWLSVSYNTALKTLSGLGALRQVTQSVSFSDTVLESLDGLEQLTWVGGELHIGFDRWVPGAISPPVRVRHPNPSLIDVSALRSLVRVDGSLTVGADPLLESLEGLNQLRSVPSIDIRGMAALSNIDALAGVSDADIAIEDNASLDELAGFKNLVSGQISVVRNPSLRTLDALQNVRRSSGVKIVGNPLLAQIDGLAGLESCGSIWIEETQLLNIDVFANLTSTKSIDLRNNPALGHVDGLRNLRWIENGLQIWENGSLVSLQGLSGLTVAPSISIRSNDSLGSLSGLENIVSVDDVIEIESNSSLRNLDALERLTVARGDLWIAGNAQITEVSGLRNLREVNGKLTFSDNRALASLAGLSKLNRVSSAFVLSGTDSLANLDGLEGLKSAESVQLSDHASLVSLHALEALRCGSVSVTDCPVLPECEIRWLHWSAGGRIGAFECP